MKAVLIRLTDNGVQTLGVLQVFDGVLKVFECKTLELPWKYNHSEVSCIPVGDYSVKKHLSPSKGECFQIENVIGRSHILIHKGNYNKDTLGCVLVGKNFIDIDKDGQTDISSSSKTMNELLAAMDERFDLLVVKM